MDFSTHILADEWSEDLPQADWMRLALAAAAAIAPQNILAQKHLPKARKLKNTKPETLAKRRYPSGLHDHTYFEICLAVAGRANMEIAGQAFNFSAPALAFFEPNVEHSESFVSANQRYALMWISCTGSNLLATISVYNPETGWTCPQRWNTQSRFMDKLQDRFTNNRSTLDNRLINSIRSDLLFVLSELYKESLATKQDKNIARRSKNRHEPLLRNIQVFIDNHLADSLSLPYLASLARMSPNYLNSLFVKWAGMPLRSYIISRRMKKARDMLLQGDVMVKEVALQLGYEDPLYFSRAFHRYYGRWPSELVEKTSGNDQGDVQML